jgi:gas vesicle protein
MKLVLGLIFGALLGATAAVMFAPSSGKDLRTNIKSQVGTQSARVQEKWQQNYLQMQNKFNKKNGDFQVIEEPSEEVELPA